MFETEPTRLPVTGRAYDRKAARLFEAGIAACDPKADFATRVAIALRSCLSLLAADPTLARMLIVSAELSEETLRRRQYWLERYAVLLGAAATSLDDHPGVEFMELTLVSGVSYLIARQVLLGKTEDLEQQLPSLLEFILVFYMDRDEAARIAQSCPELDSNQRPIP